MLFDHDLNQVYEDDPENIKSLSEEKVEIGDILNIKNVNKYNDKHPNEDLGGENVYCVAKNENGEKLYLGFGQDEFKKPLTYSDIKKVLIDGYNENQTPATKELIKLKTDDPDLLERQKKAKHFMDDQISKDSEIVGIRRIIRPSLDRLNYYLNQSDVSLWHQQDNFLSKHYKPVKKIDIEQVGNIAKENDNSTFDSYDLLGCTKDQRHCFFLSQKFAEAVINNQGTNQQAMGLILTGMSGIGKTHLLKAIIDYANAHEKKVLYITPDKLKELYNKNPETFDYQSFLGDYDLVGFDDLNSDHGVDQIFLQHLLKYIIDNKKAVIITSNINIDLKKALQKNPVGYFDSVNKTFVVVSDLVGNDKRESWIKEVDLSKFEKDNDTNQLKLKILNSYAGKLASGIIATYPINAEDIKNDILKENKNAKIKLVPPFEQIIEGKKIYNFHIKDKDKYDTFIINISDIHEFEQFINLVPHLHDNAKKVVVIAESEQKFNSLLNEHFLRPFHGEEKEKLQSRINKMMFTNTKIKNELATNMGGLAN